jgi:hypothetical protein
MNAADAMTALDQEGIPHDTASGECGYLTARIEQTDLRFMVEAGRVVRVEVRGATPQSPAGARVGMTEDSVRALYGGGLRVLPHKYNEGRYLIQVLPGDTLRRIVFETDGLTVTEWRAGLYPQVEYVEGCS